MKTYLKAKTILCLTILSGSLDAEVYRGASHWWKQGTFSEIGTLGAQYQAIESSLANCHLGGAVYCEYILTAVDGIYVENGNRHLKFESLSRSLSVDDLSTYTKVKTIKNTGSTSHSIPLDNISNEAAKYFSFTNALMSCHLDSCKKCIPQETTMLETNNFREGAYRSTAQTIVDCYNTSESSNLDAL